MDKINKQISEKGSSAKLEKRLASANADLNAAKENIDQLQQSSAELNFMGSTETQQEFTFNETPGQPVGYTYMQNGVITMDVVSDANAIHESAHALQIFKGEIIPGATKGTNIFKGQDGVYNTDIEAYRRQYAFNPTSVQTQVASYWGSVNRISDINKNWLLGVNNNGDFIYGRTLLGASYSAQGIRKYLDDKKRGL